MSSLPAAPTPELSPGAMIGRRAFARAFDIFAVSVVAVPILTLVLRNDGEDGARFPLWAVVLYLVVPAAVEARVVARRGATPGKRLSGLAVMRRKENVPPTVWGATVRSAVSWSVPAGIVLSFGWAGLALTAAVLYGPALVTRGHADLADLLSSTRVVFEGDVADEEPVR